MATRKRKRPIDATADEEVGMADQAENVTSADDAPADAAAEPSAQVTSSPADEPEKTDESKKADDPAESEPAESEPAENEPEPVPDAPVSPRTGWVVAAFFLFWPLAIPALRASVRASEANGAGRHEEARKQSLRTLDLSLGAVCVGGFTILALVLAVVLAPTYVTPAMAARAEGYVPAGLLQAITGYPPSGASVAGPLPASSEKPTTGSGAEIGLPRPGTGGEDLTDLDGLGDDALPDGTGPLGPVDPEGTKIPDLEVGDCFDTTGIEDATVLYTVRVVPCTTPHGAEVFAETTVDDDLGTDRRAPAQETLWNAAHEYCLPEFEAFVGAPYGESSLIYWPIVPSDESWATGDRRVACVVESEQEVRGSQEGAGR